MLLVTVDRSCAANPVGGLNGARATAAASIAAGGAPASLCRFGAGVGIPGVHSTPSMCAAIDGPALSPSVSDKI